MSNNLADFWAAEYAQQAIDLLNMAGPFPSDGMVPEDQQIKMTHEEKVEFGNFMVQQDIKRDERNRKRREKRSKK